MKSRWVKKCWKSSRRRRRGNRRADVQLHHLQPAQGTGIDRIAVAGKTFRYTENGPVGLAGDKKKVVIVSTAGGVHAGQPTGAAHEGYLRTVLGFFGITDIEVVRAEGWPMARSPAPRPSPPPAGRSPGSSPRPDPRVIGKPRFSGVFALCAAARCV